MKTLTCRLHICSGSSEEGGGSSASRRAFVPRCSSSRNWRIVAPDASFLVLLSHKSDGRASRSPSNELTRRRNWSLGEGGREGGGVGGS